MGTTSQQSERKSQWMVLNLVRFWIVGLLVVYAAALTDWNSEASILENLLEGLGALFYWGVGLVALCHVGVLLYFAVLPLLVRRQSPGRRRLVAVFASPLVGAPWWYWAWSDYDGDPNAIVVLAALCLSFGLTVRTHGEEPAVLASDGARLR